MHKSVVSRAVARLIERGWVARTANARDRREAPLCLTATGGGIYRQLVPIVLDYQDRLLGGLSDRERRMLERLLDKLERQLDLPCRPAPPEPSGRAAEAILPEARAKPGGADQAAWPAGRPR